jgi:arylamine N-acetyltransferase
MTDSAIPTEDILEALELSAAAPSLTYLRALFARFNDRVPFETASKIVRDAEVGDLTAKPRLPDVFWKEHLETGAGGTCYARVAAFESLLSRLGFDCRAVLGRVLSDFDHASLLVRAGGEDWICDVGFPLPGLLRCADSETETARGTLRVARADGGWRIRFLGGVPEGPRELEIFPAPVSPEEFSRRWRQTFHRPSKFLESVSLLREREARAVSFAAGEIRVDDLHSRTRIPLPSTRAEILEEHFGVDAELLEHAFTIAGDREPEIASAEISAYLAVETSPREAFEAIASPEGYRRLMEGAARVETLEAAEGLWRARLLPPGGSAAEEPSVEEEIRPDPERRTLSVRRGSQESTYRVRGGPETFLVRRIPLAGPRLDLLRNDSLRGRFAAALAVDLLAWARLLK